MKHRIKTLTAAILGILLINACKKDKTSRGGEPGQPAIQITKASDDNTPWMLNIDAAAADREEIWVDINNNRKKDNGETVTKFGMELGDENIFSLGSSKSIVIYGKVTKFGCSSNELTMVDISNNANLIELDCGFNILTSINTTKNNALESLDCSYNGLQELDVSKNTALKNLSCYNNKLTSLNLSQNTALIGLYCFQNKLTTLDLTKNTALEQLLCAINQITSINFSQNKALYEIDIVRNQLNSANMQQLLSSLPTRSSSSKGSIYLIHPPDNNSIPAAADITNAKNKNWKLYQFYYPTGYQEL